MSNYQLSVAARQVWLHPENYVHEELRDGKRPLFKEMENQLLQGDITSDSAEDAYRTYLAKLDEVARLEIVGMFHEVVVDPKLDALHVFGRTWGTPHHYFYRNCTADSIFWKAGRS